MLIYSMEGIIQNTLNREILPRRFMLTQSNSASGIGPLRSFTQGFVSTREIRSYKYVCKYCGKITASNCALQTHILTHTGEKPFICAFCGRGFNHKQNFLLHQTLHTGKKYFKCEICGHEFNRRDRLSAHMLKHKSI